MARNVKCAMVDAEMILEFIDSIMNSFFQNQIWV